MRVLWFLPKWPHPAIDGATSAHMALLQHWFKNLNVNLDIVVFGDSSKSESEILAFKNIVGFQNLLQLPMLSTPKELLVLTSFFADMPLPATVKKFASNKAKNKFKNWSQNKEWSHIVFDGLHPAALFLERGKWDFPKTQFICTRTHNVEVELWSQMREKSRGPMKWIYKREEAKMLFFEKSLYEATDLIAPVSLIDAEKIKHILPRAEIYPTSIGMDWSYNPKKISGDKIHLLFIGRLDWYPNHEGLLWFLDEVWPHVVAQRSDIHLSIVGGFASANLIEKFHNAENLQFLGKVPDVAPYYEAASLSIIPIWTGSGTRVKAIESAKFGRSFIATAKGIEGVPLTKGLDYVEEDNKFQWIHFLTHITLEECQRLGDNLHKSARSNFDQEVIQKNFCARILGLNKK